MEGPKELSLSEIRKYMLDNGCKVTNHALVKHFKRFLTHPETQNEARKEFKTYVNILATIKNENNQKYLILRKKYLNECPSEDVVQRAVSQAGDSDSVPSSPGGVSLTSDAVASSPYRQPPPYKPPPEVSSPLTKVSQTPVATGVAVHTENVENYRDCVNEFTTAMSRIDPKRLERQSSENEPPTPTPQGEDNKRKELEEKANREKSVSRANSVDESGGNKENIPRFSFSSGSSATSTDGSGEKSSGPDVDTENPISVKEATRKFNRMASEEEAKIISPPSKKKPEKQQQLQQQQLLLGTTTTVTTTMDNNNIDINNRNSSNNSSNNVNINDNDNNKNKLQQPLLSKSRAVKFGLTSRRIAQGFCSISPGESNESDTIPAHVLKQCSSTIARPLANPMSTLYHFVNRGERVTRGNIGSSKAKEWIVSMAKANYQELAKLANEYPELVKLHLIEEKELPEVTLAHPKAKEWIVSMAKANYQELAKLANEYPELVKLHEDTAEQQSS
ncbi:Ankyrin repeat domain-containing protein SOWAHB [Lucilia cuprina]|nr:Ankyrin repeat domain-containing protein SOWAHB [Lucilia cuprina]